MGQRAKGFTLVELLVVIGIIAILISILLPSLSRARSYANNVSCLSNIRQVGQGLLFYANDHSGRLPMSGVGGPPTQGMGWINQWPAQVSMYLGATLKPSSDQAAYDNYGNVDGRYAGALRCPEAAQDATVDASWNGGFHYTANVRAMPWPNTRDGYKSAPGVNDKFCKPYPLATKDASSKMLLWDGPLYPDFGWNADTCNLGQVWSNVTQGTTDVRFNQWADSSPTFTKWAEVAPPAKHWGYVNLSPTSTSWIGRVNRDAVAGEFPSTTSVTDLGYQRYRHLSNTSCNFLYFDGHAEAKRMGEVKYRDLSIFPW